jgi:tetratricopeptide (TPR) repeat protein
MATRKIIKSKQQSEAALELEKSGDHAAAIKLYEKAAVTDPLNVQAWNRQMILYRKSRPKEDEIKLIKTAIDGYKKAAETQQQEWLNENKAKADSSRELAKVLGLLEPSGLPKSDDSTLEKWETRLYLLEYRLKNARKKKTKTVKKPSTSKPVKIPPVKSKSKAAVTKSSKIQTVPKNKITK